MGRMAPLPPSPAVPAGPSPPWPRSPSSASVRSSTRSPPAPTARLPPRTAAQLLVDVQSGEGEGAVRAPSSRPPTSACRRCRPSAAEAATPRASPRWSRARTRCGSGTPVPTSVRLALLGQLGESDLVRNGTDLWAWSSADNTATHWTVPGRRPEPRRTSRCRRPARDDAAAGGGRGAEGDRPDHRGHHRPHRRGGRPPGVRAEPGAARLPAPWSARCGSRSTASTHVPTRVQVFARGATTPAFQVGFTSFSTATPDASVFGVHPAAGRDRQGRRRAADEGRPPRPTAHRPAATAAHGRRARAGPACVVATLPADQQRLGLGRRSCRAPRQAARRSPALGLRSPAEQRAVLRGAHRRRPGRGRCGRAAAAVRRARRSGDAISRSARADSPSASGRRPWWTRSTSRCPPARSTASSARTGRARRRPSGCCSAWSPPTAGRVELLGEAMPARAADGAARGRRPGRGPGVPSLPLRAAQPAPARRRRPDRGPGDSPTTRRRRARPGRPAGRGRQAVPRLLPRHAAAARDRRRAADPQGPAGARRADQRARPPGHPRGAAAGRIARGRRAPPCWSPATCWPRSSRCAPISA